jgi:hypothetical protein
MSVRAYRAAMLSGAAFALLLFFGSGMMFGSTPDTSNKSADVVAQKYVTWLADSGHRNQVIIGCFLVVLAAIALVWFASAFRVRFAPSGAPLMGFALLAAVGAATSVMGPLALAGGHAFGDDPVGTDGNVIWLVFSLAFPALLVVFGLASSALIATILVAGRGALPIWLVILGWLAVIAGIFGVEFLPMLIVLVWYLAAGIYGAVRPAPSPA